MVHISGEEAAAINIAIGAALAWGGGAWNGWRTDRRTTRSAQADRCRDAYSALILAFDHLARAWTASETLEADDLKQNVGAVTGSAVREIQQTYVAVLLVGSDEARKKAKAARDAAWELNDRLSGRGDKTDAPKLFSLLDAFSDAARAFVQVAQHELGGLSRSVIAATEPTSGRRRPLADGLLHAYASDVFVIPKAGRPARG